MDFSDGILDRAEVIKSAKQVTSRKYPDSDDALVDDYLFTAYRPDGTSVTWDDVYTKILTEKGRRSNRSISFSHTLPYSTVMVKKLEIIKPDGKIVPVDVKANSKEMVNNSQMSANIYNPDSKVLKVNIPGLKVGDMIHYVAFRNMVKTRVPDTWSDFFTIETTSPIVNYTIEIVAPKSLPLKRIEIRDQVPGTVVSLRKETSDAIRYRWIVRNVPRMFREPNMPPLYSVTQRLLVSSVGDWSEISKWYWNLCKPHIEAVTPAMRSKVVELTRNARTPAERITAIFRFVSQKIRYMGITTEKDAPGYEPHDAKTTFENKYGVCRDKAALLAAMLRIAGFKAYPVLIMVGPKKDPDVPNPFFNHAITCIEAPNGKYLLMDSTDENTRQLFPSYLCDKSFLVAKPKGDKLRVSLIIPASENLMEIATTASINESGVMIAETTLRFNGVNDGEYRGFFAKRKPFERKRFFERIVKKVVPGAKLVEYEIKPSNIRDTSRGLRVYLKFIAERTLMKGDGKVMLPLPWMGRTVGIVNFILGKTGLEKRKYPLRTDIACGVRESLKIDLKNAVGAKIAIPKSEPLDSKTISWYHRTHMTGKVLVAKSEFLLKTVEFSPVEYLKLKHALKTIEYNQRKTPIFREAGTTRIAAGFYAGNANSVVLDEKVSYDVRNASSWRVTRFVKRKIVSYAGKKAFSELKIRYNPAWEKVTLDYARVATKSGEVKSVSPAERNLMDAAWCGAAPRYPGGKVMVVSLPGVDVGSVIEYRVVRELKDRPFFSMVEYFQGFDPIIAKTVTLKAPKNLKLKLDNLDIKGNSIIEYKTDGEGTHTWSVSDINARKWERDLPPRWSFLPSCAVSSGNWRTYSAKIAAIVEKAAEKAQKAKAAAAKLVKNTSKLADKVLKIRKFVAKRIRTAGPTLGVLPLSAATDADITLKDGYGNSLDRAALLYAMLAVTGVKPEIVLVADRPYLKDLNRVVDIPLNGFFTKVLLRTPLKKGGDAYLNDTDQYAPLKSTASEGRFAIFASSGKIASLRPDEDFETKTNIAYTIRLDESGTAEITRKRSFYGMKFAYWNKKYTEIKRERKRRLFQEMVAEISKAATPTSELKTDFSVYPGTEEFSVKAPGYGVAEGDFLYLKLPGTLRDTLGLHADLRMNPFIISRAKRMTRTYLLNLPKEYAKKIPIAPTTDVWNLPAGAGKISIVNDRDVFGATSKPILFINQDVDVRPAFIPKDEFDIIQFVASRISSRKAQLLLLERARKKSAK